MKYENKTYFAVDQKYVKLVKQYLKEGVGETNLLENKTTINFNRWKTNIEYRISLSESLDLEFIDGGYNKMTSHGTGSSFNGAIDNASGLKVLDRWKEFMDNEKFKMVLNDRKITKLSSKLFGDIIK